MTGNFVVLSIHPTNWDPLRLCIDTIDGMLKLKMKKKQNI